MSTANSMLGTAATGGNEIVSDYDAVRTQLVVGRPADNTVTILRGYTNPTHAVYLPLVIK